MEKLLRIQKRFTRLQQNKRKELICRNKKEKLLIELIDEAYNNNIEQWDVLNSCLKDQQDQSLILICDLIKIKQVLAGIKRLLEGPRYDWYA